MRLTKHRTKGGYPWLMVNLNRVVRREYGDHFTFYLRLGRFVIEVNFGRDR